MRLANRKPLNKRTIIIRTLILLIAALLLLVCDVFAQDEIWCMTDKGLFKLDGTNPTEAILVAPFNSANGMYPGDNLALASNGKLYGVTVGGGAFDYGVIFEYDPATGAYTKKYDFDGDANGVIPMTLTLASNGKLYGLTQGGGTYMSGIIYEYDPATSTFTKKLDFAPFVAGSAGAVPGSGLALAPNGKLYGTASRGGANDMGVLFEYDPATNSYIKKIDFDGTNGSYPSSDLTLAPNNKFYGTINNGGDNNLGVIFEYDPASNDYTVKYHFEAGADGAVPMSTVALGSDGKLYGATWHTYTDDYDGTLFEYDYVNDIYTTKHTFGINNDGLIPHGLTLAGNGNFYGITTRGGINDMGTLYEFNPATNAFAVKIYFNTIDGPTASHPVYFQTQTIAFSDLPAKTIGDPAFSLTATGGASGSPVLFTSSNPAVATVSGSTVTITGIGTTTITASQVGSVNYMSAPNVSHILSVVKQSQTITFNTLSEKTFGDASFALTATASSGLAVNYASTNQAVATVSGNIVTIVGAGTTTITASQAGNITYNAATDATQTLTVNKADQTLTFGTLADSYFGDTPFTLGATTSSGLSVSYASSNTSVANVSGNTVTIVGAGSTVITASQGGDPNYNAATEVLRALTVHIAGQEITFGPLADKIFGDAPFTLTATASSGLPVSYYSDDENIVTVSGNIVTIVGAGTTTITAWQEGNTNYDAANNVAQTLSVDKGTQTITLDFLAEKTFGDSPFTLPATASSGLAVSYGSSDTNVATVSGNTVTIVGVGTTVITAWQGGNANYYEATEVTQTLTVNRASQAITFTTLISKVVGDPAFELTATASSGLPVNYVSSNTSVATVSGNVVTIVAAGEVAITATQSGNATYSAAVDVQQTLTVLKKPQVITFSGPEDKTIGDEAFDLTATATSGMTVSFTSSSDNVSITGHRVILLKPGRATIFARQGGNADYQEAAPVARSFCINPAKPTVILSDVGTEAPILTSSAPEGNQWFLNGAVIDSATAETFTVTAPGVYKVRIKIDDCISEFSDEHTLIVTSVEDSIDDRSISVYPNPASDWLTVSFAAMADKKQVTIFRLNGQKIAFEEVDGPEWKLCVTDFAQGIYLLQIKAGRMLKTMRFQKNSR